MIFILIMLSLIIAFVCFVKFFIDIRDKNSPKNSLLGFVGAVILFIIAVVISPPLDDQTSQLSDNVSESSINEQNDKDTSIEAPESKEELDVDKKEDEEKNLQVTADEVPKIPSDNQLIEDNPKETKLFKTNIINDFDTNISKPKYAISDQDYGKYNRIMEYLYKYPEKTEDELFKELSSQYGQSPGQLRDFVNSNMQNVIDRDSGKTSNDTNLESSDIQNIINMFFNKNVNDPNLLAINTSQSDIKITGLRSIVDGNLEYNNNHYNYILKMEFNNDLQKVKIFQLKIDGNDIVLN